MGLLEKRMIKQGQEEWVPEAEKELRELANGSQTFDVAWDTFESDGRALENVQNQGMRRINAALRLICYDDLGKQALNEGVTKVRLVNVASVADKAVTLSEGVLEVRAAWGKGNDGYFVDYDLKKIIEKLL
jgi:hypothetical protein